jgi:hypothetical protein
LNLEKLVKSIDKKTRPSKELNLKFSDLESALNQALESTRSLGASNEEKIDELSAEEFVDILAKLSQDIAKRIRVAAEMGDVSTLNAIAEEIKDQSDSCMLLSKKIIQMADDFDLDGILKLADELDAC